MKTFYVSLWDTLGVEAYFFGYLRLPIRFEWQNGAMANLNNVSWPLQGESMQTFSMMKIHESMHSPAMFEIPLTASIGKLLRGDTISIDTSGVKVTMDASMSKAIMRQAEGAVDTFETFLAEHPGATTQDIWDAAFVAGHQTAHTLLTGEPL